MEIERQYPDLPSLVKRLAAKSSEKHTIDHTIKLMLSQQLLETKAEILKLC
jgi:hypothetical protein